MIVSSVAVTLQDPLGITQEPFQEFLSGPPEPRLSWLDLARLGQLPDQSDRRAHACSLAESKLTAKVRRDAPRRQPCVSRTNTSKRPPWQEGSLPAPARIATLRL